MWTDKEYAEVVVSLKEFVKRASKEGATPEEIAALPEVAKVLLAQDTFPA